MRPIFGEIVEVLGANLDVAGQNLKPSALEETRHCYALAEGVRACSPLGLIVEGGSMPVSRLAFEAFCIMSRLLSGGSKLISRCGCVPRTRGPLLCFTPPLQVSSKLPSLARKISIFSII